MIRKYVPFMVIFCSAICVIGSIQTDNYLALGGWFAVICAETALLMERGRRRK